MWQCGHYGYCSSCGWQNNTYPRPSYPRSSDIFVTGGCDQQEPTHPRVSIYCKQIDSLVKYIYIYTYFCVCSKMGYGPMTAKKIPMFWFTWFVQHPRGLFQWILGVPHFEITHESVALTPSCTQDHGQCHRADGAPCWEKWGRWLRRYVFAWLELAGSWNSPSHGGFP